MDIKYLWPRHCEQHSNNESISMYDEIIVLLTCHSILDKGSEMINFSFSHVAFAVIMQLGT